MATSPSYDCLALLPPGTRLAIHTASVSLLPVDHPRHPYFSLTLQRRPGDRWAISHRHQYLANDGTWSYRPCGSGLAWQAAHWHDWHAAVRLAGDHCRTIVVDGQSVDQVAADETLDPTWTPVYDRNGVSRGWTM